MSGDLPAGWYTSDEGVRRYWSGSQWFEPLSDDSVSATVPADAATAPVVPDGSGSPDVNAPLRGFRKRAWALVTAGLAALALAGAGTWWLLRPASAEEFAVERCRGGVQELLKSPSTAAFSEVTVGPLRERYITLVGLMLLDAFEDSDLVEGLGPTELVEAWGEADGASLSQEALDVAAAQVDLWSADRGTDARVVSGWVDSENGFGATVRNEFSCIYTETDGARESFVTSIGSSTSNFDRVQDLIDEVAEFSDTK